MRAPTFIDDDLDSRFDVALGPAPTKRAFGVQTFVRGAGYGIIVLLGLGIGSLAMFPGLSEFASTALFPDSPRNAPLPRSGECCHSLILETPKWSEDESESPASLGELARE